MAENKTFQVGRECDLGVLTEKLVQTYQAKGFDVSAAKVGKGISITFSKDDDGIKKFVGLAQVITANLSLNENGTLTVNFSDAEWTGKIIGFVAGWFLCFIPCLIAGYGVVKQLDLPKSIGKDIQLISGSAVPFGSN